MLSFRTPGIFFKLVEHAVQHGSAWCGASLHEANYGGPVDHMTKRITVIAPILGMNREIVSIFNEDFIHIQSEIQLFPEVAKGLGLEIEKRYGLVFLNRKGGEGCWLSQREINHGTLIDTFDNVAKRIDATANRYADQLSEPWSDVIVGKGVKGVHLSHLIEHIERGEVSESILNYIAAPANKTPENIEVIVRYMMHLRYTFAHESVVQNIEQYTLLNGDIGWETE